MSNSSTYGIHRDAYGKPATCCHCDCHEIHVRPVDGGLSNRGGKPGFVCEKHARHSIRNLNAAISASIANGVIGKGGRGFRYQLIIDARSSIPARVELTQAAADATEWHEYNQGFVSCLRSNLRFARNLTLIDKLVKSDALTINAVTLRVYGGSGYLETEIPYTDIANLRKYGMQLERKL